MASTHVTMQYSVGGGGGRQCRGGGGRVKGGGRGVGRWEGCREMGRGGAGR